MACGAQADAPDLLRLLKRQNSAEQLPLLDPAATNVGDAASPSQSLPTLQDLYSEVHCTLRLVWHTVNAPLGAYIDDLQNKPAQQMYHVMLGSAEPLHV